MERNLFTDKVIFKNIFIYILFILLGEYLLPPLRGWHASTLRKETRRTEKGEELRKGKGSSHKVRNPQTPSRVIDALIVDEEKDGK